MLKSLFYLCQQFWRKDWIHQKIGFEVFSRFDRKNLSHVCSTQLRKPKSLFEIKTMNLIIMLKPKKCILQKKNSIKNLYSVYVDYRPLSGLTILEKKTQTQNYLLHLCRPENKLYEIFGQFFLGQPQLQPNEEDICVGLVCSIMKRIV